jgi:hypothetical protein
MTEEIWKEIDGWSDYKVSNMGRVMSYCRDRDGKLLSQATYKRGGYKYIALGNIDKKTQKKYKIHRLVALNFIPNPDNMLEVDHIDQNTANNHISNLRWSTPSLQQLNTSRTRTDIEEQDPKKRRNEIEKLRKQKIVNSKRHYCNTCNYAYESNSALEKHYKTKKHHDNLTKANI